MLLKKKTTFFINLNSLAWYGSYQLWLTREDKEFATPSYLIPHLQLFSNYNDIICNT